MTFRRILFWAVFACGLTAIPALAAINSPQLGASYDAPHTNVTFKVYSSRATRIELWAYSTATGTNQRPTIATVRRFGRAIFTA